MNFNLDPEADINGTSFHNLVINENYHNLVKMLGDPHVENYPEDKIRYEWYFTSEDGSGIALYDWKQHSNSPKTWNIGSRSKESALQFKEWFYRNF